ncbi:MAG: hypothetical protein KBT30_02405 [Clostridiales bacterium]|nr:hypothetical protein [Candidatus Apopatousia equi]
MENKSQSKKTSEVSSQTTPKVVVKRKNNNNGKTIAIIALSILLGLSTVFGITAAFFTATKTATGDITLGDPVDISITQGGASVQALTFDGTAMPGTVYDQAIGVSTPANTSDCVVRGKLTITNNGATTNLTASTTSDWVAGDDDYYYYKGVMSAGDSVNFVTSITVPTTLTNVDANKVYTVSIVIEAIQFANGAASEVWTTAPSSWTTAYGSGTING